MLALSKLYIKSSLAPSHNAAAHTIPLHNLSIYLTPQEIWSCFLLVIHLSSCCSCSLPCFCFQLQQKLSKLDTTNLTYDSLQLVYCMHVVEHNLIDMHYYGLQIQMANMTRLCSTKSIVTVNGQFPGPKIVAREGDRLVVKVTNHVRHNVTFHWYIFIYCLVL